LLEVDRAALVIHGC